jgi:hypothetical protein
MLFHGARRMKAIDTSTLPPHGISARTCTNKPTPLKLISSKLDLNVCHQVCNRYGVSPNVTDFSHSRRRGPDTSMIRLHSIQAGIRRSRIPPQQEFAAAGLHCSRNPPLQESAAANYCPQSQAHHNTELGACVNRFGIQTGRFTPIRRISVLTGQRLSCLYASAALHEP